MIETSVQKPLDTKNVDLDNEKENPTNDAQKITPQNIESDTEKQIEHKNKNSLKSLIHTLNEIRKENNRDELDQDNIDINEREEVIGLDIGDTPITSLPDLTDFTEIKRLYINKTNISSLDNISELSNLEELDISDTEIHSIETLKNLPNLKVLLLDENQVSAEELQTLQEAQPDLEIVHHTIANVTEGITPLSDHVSEDEIESFIQEEQKKSERN